ncbi:putative ribosome quality control (RQC) complex YloA/Tae2 family protein [Natranaerovirga hydrolytica]|uniref:Rqc2 homolog RqcH n=1 Tax=Natranaerovirga hydrolytica TaxID=680378 RepID=A0A4R1N2V8_9FIRM|nr:NFACT RNA binding domain-containing protein [Natranaerovirga hydrolytica]TCK98344.1 putative ribosome quality control (RQC) complex YloA/Tae2 family protein [Natranaerovirga hydrolytica]
MALDGVVIANVVSELNEKLLNGRISKVYQPENDELLLVIKNNRGTYKLVLSAQASLPLLYLTDENKTNPMTPPNFCMFLRKHIGSGKIIKITQPNFERIVEFHIEHLNELGDLCTKRLIIEIMGRHSNIIFCDDHLILESIKHISHNISSVREVLPGREYVYPPNQNKKNPLEISDNDFKNIFVNNTQPVYKAIYTSLNGISPLIAQEICFRAQIDANHNAKDLDSDEIELLLTAFTTIMMKVKNNVFEPSIYYQNDMPTDFSGFKLDSLSALNSEVYDSISTVLQDFYGSKAILGRIKQKSTDIRKILSNALERSYKKYDLQVKQLQDTSKREQCKLYGELILSNAYTIKQGQTQVDVLNYYDNTTINIPLDPTLTAAQNSKKYYDRYNKLKRTYEALNTQVEETKKELAHLESINNALDFADKEDDLIHIKKELIEYGYIKKKLKEKKTNNLPSHPIHYISSDGYDIYVGKNNAQNDYLSFKFASNNDWWFHTKDFPGSHVIVKSKGDELPDKTLEEAAAVAAYYSKARQSSKVSVDYTLKKHLKKPNGSKPGFVIYHTNYSMLADPSIKGLELVTN